MENGGNQKGRRDRAWRWENGRVIQGLVWETLQDYMAWTVEMGSMVMDNEYGNEE